MRTLDGLSNLLQAGSLSGKEPPHPVFRYAVLGGHLSGGLAVLPLVVNFGGAFAGIDAATWEVQRLPAEVASQLREDFENDGARG